MTVLLHDRRSGHLRARRRRVSAYSRECRLAPLGAAALGSAAVAAAPAKTEAARGRRVRPLWWDRHRRARCPRPTLIFAGGGAVSEIVSSPAPGSPAGACTLPSRDLSRSALIRHRLVHKSCQAQFIRRDARRAGHFMSVRRHWCLEDVSGIAHPTQPFRELGGAGKGVIHLFRLVSSPPCRQRTSVA